MELTTWRDRLRNGWRRLSCWALSGHQWERHREPGRLSLRCGFCGAETAGWTLDQPAPKHRLKGYRKRHRLVNVVDRVTKIRRIS